MNPNAFVTATAWSYGLALAGYLAFGVRVAFAARKSLRAHLLVFALLVTAGWAAASASIAFTASPVAVRLSAIADGLRYALWFAFLWHLLTPAKRFRPTVPAIPFALVFVISVALIASIATGEGFAFSSDLRESGLRISFVLRLGLAVFGLILVEQVLRRAEPQTRWAIKPLVVGLAGIFGLEVFFYADAMLFGYFDAAIWISRGFANLIVIPFLAIATARNTGWTVDLHLSRVAVFHSTALLVTGVFLLVVASAGYFVRYFGGEWGRTLQIELLFAALLFIGLVASSGHFRSKLKVFVSKHFFSYRYDYREEWLRFTRTLSLDTVGQNVHERTIKALADLVESPAGALWLRDEARGFVPAARWNMPAVTDAVEHPESTLAAFLERTGWIVSIDEWASHADRYEHMTLPAWLAGLSSAWLVVPLLHTTHLLGFVVLVIPRTPVVIDWEVRDMLKTASRQAASFLAELAATESLLEARKFDAFNRMSAFVVHDLKNLIAQLSLMLTNAKRHSGNPQFQADMLETVEHVVARMNSLMLQLRSDSHPVDTRRSVDLEAVVRRTCESKAAVSGAVVSLDLQPRVNVFAHEDRLEHVIGHLIQNAIDASASRSSVHVSVSRDGDFAAVIVADNGVGMSREFIRDRLFKPFQTTKATGMGIGVYESAQYVASVGGELLVESSPGAGTRVTVRLPQADTSAAPARSLQEQAA